ncbi:hypothetical protein BC828DRAFT_392532 [Blastocladiella britannica]|nr:hypothetical protein BC828DRAFT_392532 [Blastocladiella britannica]
MATAPLRRWLLLAALLAAMLVLASTPARAQGLTWNDLICLMDPACDISVPDPVVLPPATRSKKSTSTIATRTTSTATPRPSTGTVTAAAGSAPTGADAPSDPLPTPSSPLAPSATASQPQAASSTEISVPIPAATVTIGVLIPVPPSVAPQGFTVDVPRDTSLIPSWVEFLERALYTVNNRAPTLSNDRNFLPANSVVAPGKVQFLFVKAYVAELESGLDEHRDVQIRRLRSGARQSMPSMLLTSSKSAALTATNDLIHTKKVAAIVNGLGSDITGVQGLLPSRFSVPQCSFRAFQGELSDKDQYPFLFRAHPGVQYAILALRRLVVQSGWNTVAVAFSYDSFGLSFSSAMENDDVLKQKVVRIPLCPMQRSTEEKLRVELFDRIQMGGHRAIVVASDSNQWLVRAIRRQGLFTSNHTWIFANAPFEQPRFGSDSSGTQLEFGDVGETAPYPPGQSPRGTFAFSLDAADVLSALVPPGTLSTLPKPTVLESAAYSCAALTFSGIAQYMTRQAIAGNVSAIQALATAGASAMQASSKPFMLNDINDGGPASLQEATKVNATTGDAASRYAIYNWQSDSWDGNDWTKVFTGHTNETESSAMNRWVALSKFSTGDATFSAENDITIAVNSPTGIVTIVLCSIGVTLSLLAMSVLLAFRDSQPIRAISPLFCVSTLLGLVLVYLGIGFQLVADPQLSLSASTRDGLCNFIPAAGVMGFALVLGSVIAKHYRLFQLFGRPVLFRQGLRDRSIVMVAVGVVAFDVLLLVSWLVTTPFAAVKVYNRPKNELYTMCWMRPTADRMSPENLTGLFDAWIFDAIIMYNMCVLGFGVVLSRSSHRVPVRGYNEARALSVSLYNIFVGALILLPTFLTSTGLYYSLNFVLRTGVTLFSATFCLVTFFGPPFYYLFLERSSRKAPRNLDAPFKPSMMSGGPGGGGGIASRFSNAAPAEFAAARARSVSPLRDSAQHSGNTIKRMSDLSLGPAAASLAGDEENGQEDDPNKRASMAGPTLMQRPDAVDAYEGVLAMRRTHRLASSSGSGTTTSLWARMHSRLGAALSPWAMVHVSVLPHRRVLVVGDVVADSPLHITPSARPVDAIEYERVSGPDDLARDARAATAKSRATSVLPSSAMYLDATVVDPTSNSVDEDGARYATRLVVSTAWNDFTFECESPAAATQWAALFKSSLGAQFSTERTGNAPPLHMATAAAIRAAQQQSME